MITGIKKYPLDLTGLAESNRTEDEQISLPRTRSRAFAPRNGSFFANDSFKLRSLPSGEELKQGEDYRFLFLDEEATNDAGQPIVSIVHVTNTDYSGDFSYDYQVIGDRYVANPEAIKQAMETLAIDGRVVHWDQVIGKPVLFPSAPHMHHVNDLYGMDAVVAALQEMLTAMTEGDTLMKEQILERLARSETNISQNGTFLTQVQNQIALLTDRVTALETGL